MQTLGLAVVVAVLAGLAALGRRASPVGQRRNVLSVLLVVLSLIAAFLLCFALGTLVRGGGARAAVDLPCPPCSSRSTT